MISDLTEFLVSQGWDATAVAMIGPDTETEVNGVRAFRRKGSVNVESLVPGNDVILTHLGGTPTAKRYGKKYGIPVVQLIHNTNDFTAGFMGSGCDYAIYNSHWVKAYHEAHQESKLIKAWKSGGHSAVMRREASSWPSIVCRPPALESYRLGGNPDGKVTLVNLVPNKGPDIFYELAELNPSVQFLAVFGGYEQDDQVIKHLPNVEHHPHTANIDDFYSKTSVVVVPSKYESYSRVAVEAMARGIPVIGSDTPGIKECLGPTMGTLSREMISPWSGQLNKVLDNYKTFSGIATNRYIELQEQTLDDLKLFESTMREVASGSR